MNPPDWLLTMVFPVFLILALGGAAGCASAPQTAPTPTVGGTAERISTESSVEITYVLGHSRRRFLAEARADRVLVQSFMDHQILRESAVDLGHYREFLNKAQRVAERRPEPVRGPAQGASEEEVCRYPFKITVHASGGTQSTSGCRGEDDGALGRLLRDGEFLLSARK